MALRPQDGFGQIRLSINKGVSQRAVDAPNVWRAGGKGSIFTLVATDVPSKIAEIALQFFSRFENSKELLRTLLQDDDVIGREGVWELGKREPLKRLLYTGLLL
jgi:hypothetical protein